MGLMIFSCLQMREWFAHLNFSNGYPALYHIFAANIVGEGLQDYVLPPSA
jgi:hypothetical protein